MVVSRRATNATGVARSFGDAEAETDWRAALDDPAVDLVVVATRHDTHAEIAAAALDAGKAVFVEKPLGLTRKAIDAVAAAGRENAAARDRVQPAVRPALAGAPGRSGRRHRAGSARVPRQRTAARGALAERPA